MTALHMYLQTAYGNLHLHYPSFEYVENAEIKNQYKVEKIAKPHLTGKVAICLRNRGKPMQLVAKASFLTPRGSASLVRPLWTAQAQISPLVSWPAQTQAVFLGDVRVCQA